MKTYNKPELEKVLFDTEEITTVDTESVPEVTTDNDL